MRKSGEKHLSGSVVFPRPTHMPASAVGAKGANAKSKAPQAAKKKIGLALAGGGPLGAMYEIGVLMALDEALEGLDLNDIDVYVGVSAGSFITAGLANQLTPAEIYRLFIENKATDKRTGALKPEVFLRPATREYWRSAKMVPRLVAKAVWDYVSRPLSGSLMGSFGILGKALPTGIFDNHAIREFLRKVFNEPGRTDDFRKLKHQLFSVATDLDTGESVRFGGPGFDHVPISKAVQASAALPGLFPPVRIGGRYYVDGALKKTLNASVALEAGAQLVLCVNPLVPFDANLAKSRAGANQQAHMKKLVEGGLPAVLAQTYRAIIHSRMHVSLANYVTQYKNADVVLFEPRSDDAEMFFTNIFSYATRRRVCEHAYQRTREDLLKRHFELEPILEKYGITMNLDVLRDEKRTLDHGLFKRSRKLRREERLQSATLDLSDAILDLERWAGRENAKARAA